VQKCALGVAICAAILRMRLKLLGNIQAKQKPPHQVNEAVHDAIFLKA